MRIILFVLFCTLFCTSYSQIVRESEILRRMDHGRDLMEAGDYENAQVEFLFVLENKEKLPSEMAYYFGRNSFHLEKHKQSINWLNKYIQLKGSKGRFYESSIRYLQLAEDEYIKIRRGQVKSLEDDLENSNYDCGGLEKMLCPVCHGDGVIITEGTFDLVYRTCPYSEGEGFLSCEEFNLFMRGELEPKLKN
ncbi:MAG: hypothetical protein AAGA66_13730 [Bacteroidota bacterium]